MFSTTATSIVNAASRHIANQSRAITSLSSTLRHPNKEHSNNINTADTIKPYIPLYHHQDPTLFPPLVPGSIPYIFHNATAALQALIALASDEELRQKFVSIAKIYGLTTQPQVNVESEEDVNNLYSGCILNTNVVGQSDMGLLNVFSLFGGLSSPLYDLKDLSFNIKEFMDGAGYALDQFHKVDRDFFMSLKKKHIDQNYDFIKVAKENPESLEHDLMKMTTPPFWMYLNKSLREYFGTKQMNEVAKMGSPTESKVVNLALISARVAEIEKPESLDTKENDQVRSYSTLNQIVTQLEVLYERELLPNAFGEELSNIVNVATFEACIMGDPNGEKLQWRLCQTRPATEFPYLV